MRVDQDLKAQQIEPINRMVFFKQYNNPPKMGKTKLYKEFVEHQDKLRPYLDVLAGQNIIEKNIDYFEYDVYYCQTKEHLTGNNLAKMLWDDGGNAVPMDIETIFNLGIVIVGILKQIHINGIIHSDLKPEQIFLQENDAIEFKWQAKYVDFDNSIFDKDGLRIALSTRVGTQCYFSPEHLRNEDIAFESDIFTLGLILYELFLHDYPYNEPDNYERDIMNGKKWKSPMDINKSFPKELSNMIYAMVSFDKQKRPKIAEVHEALLKARELCIEETRSESEKSSEIYLEMNGKRVIIENKLSVTRELCKEKFGKYNEIYSHQFTIIKGNDGKLYIKGYDIPLKIEKDGMELNFYSTKLNGKEIDTTGFTTNLSNNDEIQVNNTIFIVKID